MYICLTSDVLPERLLLAVYPIGELTRPRLRRVAAAVAWSKAHRAEPLGLIKLHVTRAEGGRRG